MEKKNTKSRTRPTKVNAIQVAPHVKTLSNGKSRPKKRGR